MPSMISSYSITMSPFARRNIKKSCFSIYHVAQSNFIATLPFSWRNPTRVNSLVWPSKGQLACWHGYREKEGGCLGVICNGSSWGMCAVMVICSTSSSIRLCELWWSFAVAHQRKASFALAAPPAKTSKRISSPLSRWERERVWSGLSSKREGGLARNLKGGHMASF